MHKLLEREIERALADVMRPPTQEAWQAFLTNLSDAFDAADAHRRRLERSLALASDELAEWRASSRRGVGREQGVESTARNADSVLEASLDRAAGSVVAVDALGNVATCDERGLFAWELVDRAERPPEMGARLASAQLESRDAVLARARGRVLRPLSVSRAPWGRVWLLRDLAIQRHVLEEARRSEARFRALVENVRDVISVVDASGACTYVSPSVARVLGYAPEEMIGQDVRRFVHPDDERFMTSCLSGLPRGEDSLGFEVRARHKSGSWRVLESLQVDARDLPGVRGFVGVSRDVTEKRRLKTEAGAHQAMAWRRERLSSLGTFVAGIAHEINNPLSYIVSNLEFALEDVGAAAEVLHAASGEGLPDLRAAKRQLETAARGAERIARITSALGAIALRGDPIVARVDLARLVADAAALVDRALPPNVTLDTRLPEGEALVEGDASGLRQVVLHLARNAVEATSGKGGRVTLALELRAGGWSFSVHDSGPGISPDVLPKLFTPFFTTKPDGVGLGLALAHAVLERHGGTLHVESSPAGGATLRANLPHARGPARSARRG